MKSDRAALADKIRDIPPADNRQPVFRAPWEAQAFAMTLALHEAGYFTWPEWVGELSTAIASARSKGDPDTGENYYEHWLRALEAITTRKKLFDPGELAGRREEWRRAAVNTPHGQPIELSAAKK